MGHWVTLDDGRHVYIEQGDIQVNYSKYVSMQSNPKEMIKKFTEDTHIAVDDSVLDGCTTENLGNVLDTVAQVKRKYGLDNVQVIGSNTTEEFDLDCFKDKNGNHDPEVWAAYRYSSNALVLNEAMYKKSSEQLNEKYKKDMELGWSPKGNANSVLLHELGHAATYKMIDTLESKLGTSIDEWNDCANYYMHKTDFNGSFYGDNKLISEIGRKFSAAENELKAKGYTDTFWDTVAITGRCTKDGYLEEFKDGHKNKSGVGDYATTNMHECLAEVFADVLVNKSKASPVSQEIYKQFFGGIDDE